MMIKIAIVGGGPGGVSLCMQLKKELLQANLQEKVEILVFEKTSHIGFGVPYAAQEECHILNLPKEVMEPMPGETNQFSQWYGRISNDVNQTSFPPRHYFGKYLQSMAIQTQIEGEIAGLTISYHTENEVLDIVQEQNGLFEITAAHGQYLVHYVILSTGHMPSTLFTEFEGYEGYIHNSWNISDYKQINPYETVGIIGTRLTAIDAALKLRAMNHKGKIIMASRSGLLPTVLGREIPHYTLKYLTLEALHELTRSGGDYLKLNDLASLFWKEIDEVVDEKCHLNSFPRSFKDISAFDWINNEILESERGSRSWQQVLFALYPLTPIIWTMLRYEDKAYFLKTYNSLFINYLAAFPLDNAYKIKEMLSCGSLEICGDLSKVEYNKHYILHVGHEERKISNYLINATGPGYDPAKINFLKKMMDRSIISKHPFGGIKVDTQTFQVIGGNDKTNSNLFAIGELTKGDCFLTTDLSITTSQARQVTSILVNQLEELCAVDLVLSSGN